MAPRLVAEGDLIERLITVLGSNGFDGASLSDIAAATGLQKSSLYHRFPGGKEQMAAETVAAVARRFTSDVLAPLSSDEPVGDRVQAVGDRLRAFYDDGRRSCLLDVLSVGHAGAATVEALAATAQAWIEAFAAVSREAGFARAAATARAQDAVASIEGALVVARVTGDRRAFDRAIDRLPHRLTQIEGDT